MPVETSKYTVASLLHDKGMEGLLGVNVDEIRDDFARVTMVLKEEHLNFAGSGHGGVLFALADAAFAVACNTGESLNVASGCSIEFVRAGRVGDTLTAVAKLVERSGKSAIYDIAVKNQHGDVLVLVVGRAHQTSKPLSELM